MPIWPRYVSIAAVGVLGVALVGAVGALSTLLARSFAGIGDPHGYVAIFGTVALVFLLPPTLCAVVALVGLVRRRTYGYVWAVVAHAWVACSGLLMMVVSGSPGLPVLAVAFGVGCTVVAVLGLRGAGAEPYGAVAVRPPP